METHARKVAKNLFDYKGSGVATFQQNEHTMDPTAFHLGQLRHLYAQMKAGLVTNTAQAADGLLGPAIAHFEYQLAKINDAAFLRDAATASFDKWAKEHGKDMPANAYTDPQA